MQIFSSPSSVTGLSERCLSHLEKRREPAGRCHPPRLWKHDVDQRTQELHLQGGWFVFWPFHDLWQLTNKCHLWMHLCLHPYRFMRRADGGEPWWWSGGHRTLQHLPGNGGCYARVHAASGTGSCQKADYSYHQYLFGHQGNCFWKVNETLEISCCVFYILH